MSDETPCLKPNVQLCFVLAAGKVPPVASEVDVQMQKQLNERPVWEGKSLAMLADLECACEGNAPRAASAKVRMDVVPV